MWRPLMLLLVMAAAAGPALGGEEGPQPAPGQHYPVNLSFYYPASLNRSEHDSANLNLSVIYGRLRAVDGLDVSAGGSALSQGLRGVQLCGLGCVLGERGQGVQAAGLASISGEGFSGLQLAGLASIAGENHRGLQAAGLMSIVGEDLEGFQIAGLMSITGERADGVQLAGLANISGASASLTQVAAGFNVVGDYGEGVQLAGLFNVTGDDFEGIQAAGLFNVTGGTLRGAQLGAANVAGRSEGLQIGLFNACGECEGFQLGLVNRAKGSNHGLAIGLVTLAENGRIRGVVWAGSTAGLSGGVKLSLGRTYSLVSLGLLELDGDVDTAPTLGVHYGVAFPLGGRNASADVGYRYRDAATLFSHSEQEPDQHVLEARVGVTFPLGERLDLMVGGGAAYVFDRGRSFGSGETSPLVLAGLEFR